MAAVAFVAESTQSLLIVILSEAKDLLLPK
jgi:hypothetical protein